MRIMQSILVMTHEWYGVLKCTVNPTLSAVGADDAEQSGSFLTQLRQRVRTGMCPPPVEQFGHHGENGVIVRPLRPIAQLHPTIYLLLIRREWRLWEVISPTIRAKFPVNECIGDFALFALIDPDEAS
jgi:hypothetical protein